DRTELPIVAAPFLHAISTATRCRAVIFPHSLRRLGRSAADRASLVVLPLHPTVVRPADLPTSRRARSRFEFTRTRERPAKAENPSSPTGASDARDSLPIAAAADPSGATPRTGPRAIPPPFPPRRARFPFGLGRREHGERPLRERPRRHGSRLRPRDRPVA